MGRPKKRPIAQHWELHNGKPVLVLFRNSVLERTERCPYCCENHLGSIRDGHTFDYCPEITTFRYIDKCLQEIKLTPNEIVAADGTVLKRENGYIIKTKPDAKSRPQRSINSLSPNGSRSRQTDQRKRPKTALVKRSKRQ